MPTPLRWPDAVLGGLASGLRTFSGPSLMALRGRIGGRSRIAVLIAAGGELATDKAPFAVDRTEPPALAGRIGAGAYTGWSVAGPVGIAVGAASAMLGSYASFRARKLAVARTGWPDPVVAVGEDLLAYTAAAIATRDEPPSDGRADVTVRISTEPEVEIAPPRSPARDAIVGLLAGIAGTAAMSIAQGAEFVLTDAEPSLAPAEVADTLKRRLGLGRLKRRHRSSANQAMHWLYGSLWGIPYGIAAASSGLAPELSGPVFGQLVWGVGLAQQPALGLAEPPWKRSLQSLGSEALFHLVYGIGAGAALRALRGRR